MPGSWWSPKLVVELFLERKGFALSIEERRDASACLSVNGFEACRFAKSCEACFSIGGKEPEAGDPDLGVSLGLTAIWSKSPGVNDNLQFERVLIGSGFLISRGFSLFDLKGRLGPTGDTARECAGDDLTLGAVDDLWRKFGRSTCRCPDTESCLRMGFCRTLSCL